MQNKFRNVKRGYWLLFLLLFLQAQCFGAGTIQMLGGADHTVSGYPPAGALPQGSVIQFITANTPPNDIGNHLSSGSLISSGTVGGGDPVATGTNGTFNYFLAYNGSAFVRVWDTVNISGSVKGKHYRTVGSYSLPGPPTPPPTHNLDSFATTYLADKPPVPSANATGFVLSWDGTLYKPAFYLKVVEGTNPLVETAPNPVKYNIHVRKVGETTWPKTYDGNNAQIWIEKDDYYVAGQNYQIEVQANNYFGASGYSSPISFTIPLGEGGQCGPITYTLVSPAEGIGLNDISILHEAPFNVDTDPAGSVSTIGELVNAINSKAKVNVVTAVGILTDNQIQGAYVTYDQNDRAVFTPTAGFAEGANTALKRGMGLQISIQIEGGGNVEVTFF